MKREIIYSFCFSPKIICGLKALAGIPGELAGAGRKKPLIIYEDSPLGRENVRILSREIQDSESFRGLLLPLRQRTSGSREKLEEAEILHSKALESALSILKEEKADSLISLGSSALDFTKDCIRKGATPEEVPWVLVPDSPLRDDFSSCFLRGKGNLFPLVIVIDPLITKSIGKRELLISSLQNLTKGLFSLIFYRHLSPLLESHAWGTVKTALEILERYLSAPQVSDTRKKDKTTAVYLSVLGDLLEANSPPLTSFLEESMPSLSLSFTPLAFHLLPPLLSSGEVPEAEILLPLSILLGRDAWDIKRDGTGLSEFCGKAFNLFLEDLVQQYPEYTPDYTQLYTAGENLINYAESSGLTALEEALELLFQTPGGGRKI